MDNQKYGFLNDDGIDVYNATKALSYLLNSKALRQQFGFKSHHRFPLRPVIDGSLLQFDSLTALSKTKRLPKAIVVGFNLQEANYYLIPGKKLWNVIATDVERFIKDAGLPTDIINKYPLTVAITETYG